MSKGKHAKPFELPELDMSNPWIYWGIIVSVVVGSFLLVWAFLLQVTR